MDETALYFKMSRTRALSTVSLPGRKPDRLRITVALCCNADGLEKYEAFIISRSKNGIIPRDVRKMDSKSLGCHWVSNEHAWMTGDLMEIWLERFYEYIGTEREVILLMDNFSGHLKGQKEKPPPRNVTIAYLPPNTTCLFQPLDQGIIQTTKAYYKSQLLEYCIPYWTEGTTDPYKLIKYLNALTWISHAWHGEVKPSTIRNCFRKSTLFDILDDADETGSLRQADSAQCFSGDVSLGQLADYLLSEANITVNSASDSDVTLCNPESDNESEAVEFSTSERNLLDSLTLKLRSSSQENEATSFDDHEDPEGDHLVVIEGVIARMRRLYTEANISFIEDPKEFAEPAIERQLAAELELEEQILDADKHASEKIQEFLQRRQGNVDIESELQKRQCRIQRFMMGINNFLDDETYNCPSKRSLLAELYECFQTLEKNLSNWEESHT